LCAYNANFKRELYRPTQFETTPDGDAFAPLTCMNDTSKRYVYVLRSETGNRPYVGVTCNVAERLATHNSGGSAYTAPHRPWRLIVSLEFATEAIAIAFEQYLKTGSGRAFAKRHFV
jgi:predicted GIY-YIG superfamily endonuclease